MDRRVKDTFSTIFIFLVILLLVLPFITTFNELITAWFLKFGWYRGIESIVVPWEIRSIIVFLKFLGIQAVGSSTTLSILREGVWQKVWISWNCVGWQSAILLFLTSLSGLSGTYKRWSVLQTILIGVLGTFLVNIIRITAVVLIFKFAGLPSATIFHDYFANMAIIVWFFFFWWFAYSFILEPREE